VPDNPPPHGTSPPPTAALAPVVPAARKPRRTHWRWWFLLVLAGTASLLLSPAPWHAVLRSFLTWRAAAQGWDLRIGGMEGGLFDSTELYHIRCVQKPGAAVSGTDFRIERGEIVFAWHRPFSRESTGSWVRRITVEGLSGTADLTRAPAAKVPAAGERLWPPAGWRQAAEALIRRTMARTSQALARQIGRLDPALLPRNLEASGKSFTLRRGRYHLRSENWRLTAAQVEIGHVAAQRLEVAGPDFDSTLRNINGWTYWKDSSLTFGDIDLGRGVHLASATLNGAHLRRQQLDWEGDLRALGGRARGQGAVNFSKPRLSLEIAGSLEKMAVGPLARLLGVRGQTAGEVQQANFTFRGDPENLTAAQMWLAADATDFRWGARRWESLELQGVVINGRAQVHRLELRQSGNQLSFTGECALPIPGESATAWWQAGGSCNVDARIDDLHALAELAGGQLPDLRGKMSVNGTLSAHPGAPGIDGYLNVEGSALTIRGAPLDSLRATLLFKGNELNVPDLEATRGGDYFRALGSVQISGPARYQAELHAAIKDLTVYAPAYADLAFTPQPISGSLVLDWSGDGTPAANSGAFSATTEQFFTKGGPAALARPIDLSADATYSPESVSFRHLVLQEGTGAKRHDAWKLEGALPWTRDARAFAAGRWLDPSRPMAVRVVCLQAPLDMLAGLAPKLVAHAEGQLTGWLNADGTLRSPKLEGDLQLKNASFQPADGTAAIAGVDARLRLEKSVLFVDQATGRWGSQTIDAAGSADLGDTANIGLDLTLHGNDSAGVHNEAVAAGLGYTLALRGVLGGEALISGELNLLAGVYEQPLSVWPAPFAGAATWLNLAQWSPFAWPNARLDVHVGALPGLRLAGGAGAELTPDLQMTGTAHEPRIAGELLCRQAPLRGPGDWLGTGNGAWYFAGGEPGNPLVSIVGRSADGSEVFFYGPADAARAVTMPDPKPAWAEPNAMAAFVDNAL
jgi:hypothetical protein